MKLLVIGAGPIGSLYAGRLAEVGHEVTLLARGARLATLRGAGLSLLAAGSKVALRPRVTVTDHVAPETPLDVAMIAIRYDRLPEALPALRELRGARRLVTLVNQPDGGARAAGALGPDRLVLGFPGATAALRADGAVTYAIVPGFVQRTTFGDAEGGARDDARALARACVEAGFPSAVSHDMPAWLRTHAAFIGPLGAALLESGGLDQLAGDPVRLGLFVDGVREGFAALRASGSLIEPAKLAALERVPRSLLLWITRAVLGSSFAQTTIGGHTAVSPEEMTALLAATLERSRDLGLRAPACEELTRLVRALGRPAGS